MFFQNRKMNTTKNLSIYIEGKIKVVNDKKILFRREFLKKTFSCLVSLTFCYFLTETNVKKPTFNG